MSESATILLVEDDQPLLDGIADLLEVSDIGYSLQVIKTKDGEEVYFDLMNPETYEELKGDVKSLDFKNIKNRLRDSPYLGMNTSPKEIYLLELELGGRYILDEIGSDNPEWYRRFSLTLHSIQQANKEKIHISDPALFVAVSGGGN